LPVLQWGSRSCLVGLLILGLVLGGSVRGVAENSARDRTISFYNIHTQETLTVQYMKDGKHLAPAMEQINWILRDWRLDEKTTMDPDLIDLVWEIHNQLGSTEPIHIISGFRSHTTNEMLRRTVGGQASQSRHILGKAMDVYFPDVPLKTLRYSALIRERGGVGYYPTSAIPFVHIDTDRVRAWPRLPRTELALLFPSGHTQHVPDDGGNLTRADFVRAQASNPELAQEVAALHSDRVPLQLASLTPALRSAPRLAERPLAQGTMASSADRARLAELLREEPQLLNPPAPASRNAAKPPAAEDAYLSTQDGAPVTFAAAPAYDDEHPEELSYRPFAIAPLLTPTASPDCPELTRLVRGDLGKALEMIGDHAPAPRLRLSFGAAQLMWAQHMRAEASDFSVAGPDLPPPSGAAQVSRRVASEPLQ
jgi:uncharacterized protein YcbK (DUF882 family)